MTTTANSWINTFTLRPQARLRLFCFPYAGGSAAVYRPWLNHLPESVELCAVELPGRGARLRERPFQQLGPLAQAAAEGLLPFLDKPFAVFGHSLGGLLAFEVVRLLRRRGCEPLHLFVSSRRAPHAPENDPPIHHLPESAFVAEVGNRYNGIPKAVRESPELMQLMLPVMRADFAVFESYVYAPAEPLACPISVFGGRADQRVAQEHLAGWREHTRSTCTLRLFEGGHFYWQDEGNRAALLAAIAQELQPWLNGK